MARRPRIDLAGVHHVINRGVNRSDIFITDKDYEVFMRILDKAGMADSVGEYPHTLVSAIINRIDMIKCVKQSRLINELSYETIQEIIGITLSADDLDVLWEIQGQKSRKKSLKEYFLEYKTKDEKNKAIIISMDDGYTHQEVSDYLDVSKAMISKVIKSSQIQSDP